MMRSPSSNPTPLTLTGGSFGCGFFAGFCFFTVSFPSPTIADCAGFHKAVLRPRKAGYSNRLLVCEPLAFRAFDALDEPSAVRYAAVVPSEGELVRVLREVLSADVMPSAIDAALEQAEEALAGVYVRQPAIARHPERVLLGGMVHGVVTGEGF